MDKKGEKELTYQNYQDAWRMVVQKKKRLKMQKKQ